MTVKAYVDPAAQCGSRAVVSYLGGVDDFVYSFAPNKVLDVAMPATGNCQVATQCAAQLPSFGTYPKQGIHLNPTRGGNGQNLFNYGNILSAAWFTGKADRTPVWYLVNGEWNPALAQATAQIFKVKRTSSSPITTATSAVGSAQFTRGDDDSIYINTWEFNGVWAADKMVRVFLRPPMSRIRIIWEGGTTPVNRVGCGSLTNIASTTRTPPASWPTSTTMPMSHAGVARPPTAPARCR